MIEPNTKATIAIDVDLAGLHRVLDSRLAMLWHVAQANPAPYGDEQAGELVAKVGWEIIRRWLASTPAEMYHHQQDHYRGMHLSRFASYRDGDWHPNPEKIAKYQAEQASSASPSDGEYVYCGAALGTIEPPFTCERRVTHDGPCSPDRDHDTAGGDPR